VCGGRRLVAVLLTRGLVHHSQHGDASALAEVARHEPAASSRKTISPAAAIVAEDECHDDPELDDEIRRGDLDAIAAVKFAHLENRDRASATAAAEQDDDAAPRSVAIATDRGESSPISRRMSLLRTAA
jgi:hypothetical protein